MTRPTAFPGRGAIRELTPAVWRTKGGPDRWGEVFGDDTVAAAMIDRLGYHADIITLKGDSYHLKDHDLGRVPAATGDN